jgi:hypothetical protein
LIQNDPPQPQEIREELVSIVLPMDSGEVTIEIGGCVVIGKERVPLMSCQEMQRCLIGRNGFTANNKPGPVAYLRGTRFFNAACGDDKLL